MFEMTLSITTIRIKCHYPWQGSLTEGEGVLLYTVDLLVLTSLDQLIFKLIILISFLFKASYLNEEVNCTEPSPYVSIPCSWCCIAFIVMLSVVVYTSSVEEKVAHMVL
jgi:hypothetical protein